MDMCTLKNFVIIIIIPYSGSRTPSKDQRPMETHTWEAISGIYLRRTASYDDDGYDDYDDEEAQHCKKTFCESFFLKCSDKFKDF